MQLLTIILFLGSTSVVVVVPAAATTKSYSSYRPIPLCRPNEYFRYPENVGEAIDIIKEAIQKGTTVKVVGARHSQTDIICTEGIPVDNHELKSFFYNETSKRVTLGAGVTLYEATRYLRKIKRAFRMIPQFGNITIGGAIGTGAHGSSIKYPASISSQVVGLTFIDGLGQVQTIDEDSEFLNAFKIHLGLLGFIVNVTLRTVSLYKTKAHNYLMDDVALTDGRVQEWAETHDEISVYWFPSLKNLVIANWTVVPVQAKGKARTYDHAPSTHEAFSVSMSNMADRVFDMTESPCTHVSSFGYEILQKFESFMESTLFQDTPGFVPIYTENGFTVKNPAIGYYDDMLAPTCKEDDPSGFECPWAHGRVNANLTMLDNEVSFNLDDLPLVVNAVRKILKKTPTFFPLQGILLRFSAASDIYMSSAYGNNTVHFEWYTWLRKDRNNKPAASLAGYQAIMQSLVYNFGGRPHWGKNGMAYHTTEVMNKSLDPNARRKFIEAMEKFDPNGVFLNNFGRRLKGVGTKRDLDPKVERCGLIDNCHCSEDEDCGPNQECGEVEGFPVCKTLNEKPSMFSGDSSKSSSSGGNDFLSVSSGFIKTMPLTGDGKDCAPLKNDMLTKLVGQKAKKESEKD